MLQSIYDSIDPIAFSIGPLQVRWYGLAYVIGFMLAILIIWRVAKRWKVNITSDEAATLLLIIMVSVLLGGRLGYCLFYGDGYYLSHPLKILALNEGGMSFHGGMLGVAIGALIATKTTKIRFRTLADIFSIAAPAGLFFGRIANFINGELWGSVTDVSWGVVFSNAGSLPRHPTQLYEAILEGIILFAILIILSRKNPPMCRGSYFGIFLICYGVFRIAIEFVRQPDAQLGYLAGDWLTMGMLLSVPMVIVGIALIVLAYRGKLEQGRRA